MTNPEPTPMRLFEVLIDGDGIANSYQVDAAYYRLADGWITFKDADNKVVYDFPAGRVRMIHRIDPPKAEKPPVKAEIIVDWNAVQAEARETKHMTADDYVRIAHKHAHLSV